MSMEIIKKLAMKEENLRSCNGATIAFLGDSVTQGCFECYLTSPTTLQTVFDYQSAYSTRVREMLNLLYPKAQVNIINSGISGDSAPGGLERLERDVLLHNPDLVVVSFGLNDCAAGMKGLSFYANALEGIFSKIKARGIEIIFLTQNFNCTKTSPHLRDELFINLSKTFAKTQNDGVLKAYFQKAKQICKTYGVKVCDLYPVWEKLAENGVDTTELLANKLNHPVREIHYYMAMKLIETMLLN